MQTGRPQPPKIFVDSWCDSKGIPLDFLWIFSGFSLDILLVVATDQCILSILQYMPELDWSMLIDVP